MFASWFYRVCSPQDTGWHQTNINAFHIDFQWILFNLYFALHSYMCVCHSKLLQMNAVQLGAEVAAMELSNFRIPDIFALRAKIKQVEVQHG